MKQRLLLPQEIEQDSLVIEDVKIRHYTFNLVIANKAGKLLFTFLQPKTRKIVFQLSCSDKIGLETKTEEWKKKCDLKEWLSAK